VIGGIFNEWLTGLTKLDNLIVSKGTMVQETFACTIQAISPNNSTQRPCDSPEGFRSAADGEEGEEEPMTMFYKEYLLFRDGWDDESEKEIEEQLVECAASPSWQNQFLPAFVEMLKREQFIKIMECLDKDKNLEFNRGFVAGIDLVLNRLDRIYIKARPRNQ